MIRRLLDWLFPPESHGVRAHFEGYRQPERGPGESLRKYRDRQIDVVGEPLNYQREAGVS